MSNTSSSGSKLSFKMAFCFLVFLCEELGRDETTADSGLGERVVCAAPRRATRFQSWLLLLCSRLVPDSFVNVVGVEAAGELGSEEDVRLSTMEGERFSIMRRFR